MTVPGNQVPRPHRRPTLVLVANNTHLSRRQDTWAGPETVLIAGMSIGAAYAVGLLFAVALW